MSSHLARETSSMFTTNSKEFVVKLQTPLHTNIHKCSCIYPVLYCYFTLSCSGAHGTPPPPPSLSPTDQTVSFYLFWCYQHQLIHLSSSLVWWWNLENEAQNLHQNDTWYTNQPTHWCTSQSEHDGRAMSLPSCCWQRLQQNKQG